VTARLFEGRCDCSVFCGDSAHRSRYLRRSYYIFPHTMGAFPEPDFIVYPCAAAQCSTVILRSDWPQFINASANVLLPLRLLRARSAPWPRRCSTLRYFSISTIRPVRVPNFGAGSKPPRLMGRLAMAKRLGVPAMGHFRRLIEIAELHNLRGVRPQWRKDHL
jgi:hypothetical protein